MHLFRGLHQGSVETSDHAKGLEEVGRAHVIRMIAESIVVRLLSLEEPRAALDLLGKGGMLPHSIQH